MNIIQRIVSPIGRRVDEATPYVDARLPDGSRVNVVIPPIALDGPMVSIRKFREQAMGGQDYVRLGSMSQEMLGFLAAAVRSRLNILICGGTGSGKTTLLNMLSSYIGEKERLITIEDAAELQLRQSHVVRLETRPPNLDGSREVTARDLVRNALRMRPDRIILGEVRGAEAVEMLQAMSTGHDGSMATMHANTSRDAFGRLEMLLGFGGLTGDPKTLRRYIANSIQIVVQVSRMANGKRRITSVSELTGMEGESYSLNQLFSFEEQPPLSGLGEFATPVGAPVLRPPAGRGARLRAAVARGLSMSGLGFLLLGRRCAAVSGRDQPAGTSRVQRRRQQADAGAAARSCAACCRRRSAIRAAAVRRGPGRARTAPAPALAGAGRRDRCRRASRSRAAWRWRRSPPAWPGWSAADRRAGRAGASRAGRALRAMAAGHPAARRLHRRPALLPRCDAPAPDGGQLDAAGAAEGRRECRRRHAALSSSR